MSIRTRALVGAVATLGVVGTSVGWWAAQAPQHAATQLEVDDTAGVLHEPSLRMIVDEVRFYEPTDVAVLTHRGGQEAQVDDLALNDAVLEHARENRPEWLSGDGQRWADDLYLFAVDPEGRLVGTYFGDNRAIGEDAQLDVQDATKDELRARRWTEGAGIGIEAAAARMNAPFPRTVGGGALLGGTSLATLAGSGAWLGTGLVRARRSREARAEGDTLMASVVAERDVTELHARLLPEGTRYGGLMLRRYDEYQKGFRELTELGNRARAVPEREYDAPATLTLMRAYRDKAQALDHLDDVIADTAALLNRDRAWAEAWHRQVTPVREELEDVEPMLDDDLPEEVRGTPEAQAVRAFASQALVGLDRLRGELESQAVSPDDALDRLRATRDDLGAHLDRLAGVVATTFDDTGERDLMVTELNEGRRTRVSETTIVSYAYPTWTWFAVGSFRSSYSAGHTSVEQSRSSSSSGGSSSGYSGGGSFSGAGSSSRF